MPLHKVTNPDVLWGMITTADYIVHNINCDSRVGIEREQYKY